MDSKKIIEKLFKIAVNQQKILTKLAQVSPEGAAAFDESVESDRKLILNWTNAAAFNLGLGIAHQIIVTATPDGRYVVNVDKLGDKQEKFKDLFFRAVVANNRQDLSSKITFNLS